jgi:SAM-dependent methyltransferase
VPDDAVPLQLATLESLAAARNYNSWICDLTLPYLGSSPLEIGSGLGDLAALWLEAGLAQVVVSEPTDEGVDVLRRRFADDPRVSARRVAVPGVNESAPPATGVAMVNVLEHIEDDVGALAAARQLVDPGGAVVVFTPAHPFAMSAFDRAIGHWRRYTLGSLGDAYTRAGLQIEQIRHINAVGLVAWVVMMKLLRRTPTDTRAVRFYDRLVVPGVRACERRVTPPFGQSLLAVGRA